MHYINWWLYLCTDIGANGKSQLPESIASINEVDKCLAHICTQYNPGTRAACPQYYRYSEQLNMWLVFAHSLVRICSDILHYDAFMLSIEWIHKEALVMENQVCFSSAYLDYVTWVLPPHLHANYSRLWQREIYCQCYETSCNGGSCV